MLRILAASCAALAFGTANAAVTSTADADPSTADLVVGEAELAIVGEDFSNAEEIDYSETFLAGPIAGSAITNIDIIFDDGDPAGFDNLVVTISSSAGTFDFQVTTDEDGFAGTSIPGSDDFNVALTPGEEFTVSIAGTAYLVGASSPFFQVTFEAVPTANVDEVPLPAGAFLMLSGLGAYTASRRARRKAA
jgi:hypothetical protein